MRSLITASMLALTLAACGHSAPGPASNGGGEIKAEAFCNNAKFPGPLRETFVLIDAKAAVKTASAREFAEKNEWLRDVLIEIADPKRSLASGFMAPRERVTIISLPADGSTGSRVFTGCVPGLSAEEREQVAADASAVEDFFGGTTEGQFEDTQANFRTRLIGGLQSAAAQSSDGQGSQTGPLSSSPLIEAFVSSQGLFDSAEPVRRFVFVSDLSGIEANGANDGSPSGSFTSGISDARQMSGDFGLSEIFLIQPPGTKLANKDYLRGFLLAKGGDLVAETVAKVGLGPAAPVKRYAFKGKAHYPSGAQPLEIHVAADREGNLVDSWMVLLGQDAQPVPFGGTMQCSDDDSCVVTSKPGKFSQSWSARPGGEAEFANDLPFGGMRNVTLTFGKDELTGKVSDPAVGNVGDGRDFIMITAKSMEGARS